MGARREAEGIGNPFIVGEAGVSGAREVVAVASGQELDRVRSVHDAHSVDVLVHGGQLRREVGGRG